MDPKTIRHWFACLICTWALAMGCAPPPASIPLSKMIGEIEAGNVASDEFRSSQALAKMQDGTTLGVELLEAKSMDQLVKLLQENQIPFSMTE